MEIQVVNIALNILILIGGLYLIFFKSYFKEKGKNLATFEDVEAITEKVENVKKDFNIKLEELKSELQKNNIAYQINLSELIKVRFQRIDNLYENLSVLNKFIAEDMLPFDFSDENYNSIGQEYLKKYDNAVKSSIKCDLYITDNLKLNIDKILQSAHLTYIHYIRLYNTDPDRFKNISQPDKSKQRLTDKKDENYNTMIKFKKLSNKISDLLKQLEDELKKQVTLKVVE
jgi:chemotaxis protein histidine kinase CheA